MQYSVRHHTMMTVGQTYTVHFKICSYNVRRKQNEGDEKQNALKEKRKTLTRK